MIRSLVWIGKNQKIPKFLFLLKIFLNLRYHNKSNETPVLLLRDLRFSLLNFVKKVLKPGPVPFSGPFLVRPALVECCNISLNEFPLITDGIDSPFSLVGMLFFKF